MDETIEYSRPRCGEAVLLSIAANPGRRGGRNAA